MAMVVLTFGGPAAARGPDLLAPPDALLSLDGGTRTKGTLGSFCFFETGGSGGCGAVGGPLDLEPMSFSGGEDATVTLYDDSARIQRWMVEISPYPDGPEAASGESERPHPDVKEIEFSAPPPGDWRVHVSLDFTTATGSGDAFYEWRLSTMPDTAVTASTATSSTTAVLAAVWPVLVLALAFSLAITHRRRIVARG